jgi:hypothetical protein
MRSKKLSKKDNNHNEILKFLKSAVPTTDTSFVGDGYPDGLSMINGGWQWFDVKNPETRYGRSGLNDFQKKFAKELGATVYLIRTIEDAENFALGKFDKVDHFPSDKFPVDDL